MSIPVELFNQTRLVPELEEEEWGAEVTDQLVDSERGVDSLSMETAAGDIFPRRRSASTIVTAGGTLTATSPRHVLSAAAPVTLSASSAIADGEEDGQELRLEGTDDTNTVTVLDGANTDLNGLVILGAGHVIDLEWIEADSVWKEISRNN